MFGTYGLIVFLLLPLGGCAALVIISIVQIVKISEHKRRAKPALLVLGGITLAASAINLLMVELAIIYLLSGLATLIVGFYTVIFYGVQKVKHRAVQQTNPQA